VKIVTLYGLWDYRDDDDDDDFSTPFLSAEQKHTTSKGEDYGLLICCAV
jgi:hypothetical protein